jgi:acyl-CoA reductase-like NAD-dependent aldehyde dehydrogenase
VTDLSDGTRLADEEQFGWVPPIIPYRNIDDALERANATHYGLGGSIRLPPSSLHNL